MTNEDWELKFQMAHEISSLIAKAREQKHLSRYQLAKRTNIDAGHIAKIEDGFLCPRADTLHKICKALDLTIVLPLPI